MCLATKMSLQRWDTGRAGRPPQLSLTQPVKRCLLSCPRTLAFWPPFWVSPGSRTWDSSLESLTLAWGFVFPTLESWVEGKFLLVCVKLFFCRLLDSLPLSSGERRNMKSGFAWHHRLPNNFHNTCGSFFPPTSCYEIFNMDQSGKNINNKLAASWPFILSSPVCFP